MKRCVKLSSRLEICVSALTKPYNIKYELPASWHSVRALLIVDVSVTDIVKVLYVKHKVAERATSIL